MDIVALTIVAQIGSNWTPVFGVVGRGVYTHPPPSVRRASSELAHREDGFNPYFHLMKVRARPIRYASAYPV